MYRTFFGFSRLPFDRGVDGEHLFTAPQLDELAARLRFVVDTCTIGALTGEPGTGKTTALRRLRDTLHPDQIRVIYLHDTGVNAADLYRQLALELCIEPHWTRALTFRAIQTEIARLARERDLKLLLILDEAQRLRPDVLAELPSLCNFDYDRTGALGLILVGQTGLRARLRLAALEALAQRITVRFELRGLDREKTRDYVEHRLRIAGADRPLVTEPAYQAIFGASQGIMRRIDLLMHHALIGAATARARSIDPEHIVRAAEEIRT